MIVYSASTWDAGRATQPPGTFAPLYVPEFDGDKLPRLPSTFYDTDGRQFNDCRHIKPMSLRGIKPAPTFVDTRGNSLPQFYAGPCGGWKTSEGSPSPGNTNWVATERGTVCINISPIYYSSYPWTFSHIYAQVLVGYSVNHSGTRMRAIRSSVRWRNGAWVEAQNMPARMLQCFRDYSPGYPFSGTCPPPRDLLIDIANWAFSDDVFYHPPVNYTQWHWSNNWHAVAESPPTISALNNGLIFGEENLEWLGKPGRIGRSNYWLEYGRQHAFLEACESMPRLSDNSISNLQEIFEFLLSIVRREKPKIPKRLGDLWLGYRYQFNTTKMDLEEALEFVDRYIDLGGLDQPIESRGTARFNVNGVDVTMRCQIECVPRQIMHLRDALTNLSTAWLMASQYGLAPDLYYIWDSTPFSFIVDWFLPIGNILAAEDASFLYTGTNYDFTKIEYSVSYERNLGLYPYRYYTRWYEDGCPPRLSAFYWLEPNRPASLKQIAYRTLDTLSLFIGG